MIDADEARLLSEIGFLSISRDMIPEAEDIFAALVNTKPDQEVGYIGLALAALSKSDTDRALTILRQSPPTDAVAAFTALALQQSGKAEAVADIAADLLETSPKSSFAELAKLASEVK